MKTILVFLALCSPAFAVTLYTPPVDVTPSGATVWCEAVNVTQSSQTITASVISQYGEVEATYTANTSPQATGAAAYFTPDWEDGVFFFCKFESTASNKSALRASAKVRRVDPVTGVYLGAEQTVPAE